MPFHADFSRDAEFTKLLGRREDVDLTTAALEIARDAQPGLLFDPTIDWIDRRAGEVRGRVALARTERKLLQELSRSLVGRHGLHGTREAYESPESSYLNRVVETGTGIPISLSLIWKAVGQHVGIDLQGISAPVQFLLRLEADEGPLFIDAFRGGHVMPLDECIEWLTLLSGLDAEQIESMLAPASPREIVARMLNNLKALHIRQEHWQEAQQVQMRLTALQPGSFAQHRDLGLIAFKARNFAMAVELLEDCCRASEGDEQELLERHLRESRLRLSEQN